jgi:hypothetical protein
MNRERTSRFEKLLQIRFPDRVAPMVASAADRHGTQTSQYVRQAVYERLRADGFDPAPIAARDAGALYDRLSDGKTRASHVNLLRRKLNELGRDGRQPEPHTYDGATRQTLTRKHCNGE